MLQEKGRNWLCLNIGLGLILLGLPLATAVRAASEPLQIQVSYAGLSGYQLPLWLLKDHGLDKKYGLDVQTVLVRGGTMSVQALMAGSTQLAQVGGDVTVGAALRGADIVTVAAAMNRLVSSLVASPRVKTAAELKGKRVGIVRFGGMNEWVATMELQALGLEPKDVKFLQAGNVAERIVALEKGLIDASIFSYPELVKLKKMGYRVLVDAGSLSAHFPTSTIAARRDYLKKYRAIVKNFLKAYEESIHVIRTHKDKATAVLTKHTKLTDLELLGPTYDFIASNLEAVPRANLKGIENVLTELAKGEEGKKITAADLVDSSLLEELEREGFFAKLR
jgi:NitT/TauT family transport system substrate-binding protein